MTGTEVLTPRSHNRSYDGLAETYDADRFDGSAGRFLARTDARIVRELVARTGATTVYDIPVGTGRVAEYLQSMNMKVVGCDLSADMLELSRRRAKWLGGNLTLIKADASNLPFASDSVECVTCLRLLHLFGHRQRFAFIDEFQRIVRPGGYLLCSATNGFYGGCVNLVRKAMGRITFSLLMPGQARHLFAGWERVAVRGNFLPFQRFVAKTGIVAEQMAHHCVSRGSLKAMCFERFFLLRKPE